MRLPFGDCRSARLQKYKAACDAFFNRKKEHFKEQDKEYEANLEVEGVDAAVVALRLIDAPVLTVLRSRRKL